MGAVDFNDKMCRLDKDKTRHTHTRCMCGTTASVSRGHFSRRSSLRRNSGSTNARETSGKSPPKSSTSWLVTLATDTCLKRGRPSTAVTLPSRITQSSHFPVKGEGVDHVCAEKHCSYKMANPTTTYAENRHKKVTTSIHGERHMLGVYILYLLQVQGKSIIICACMMHT